MPVVVLIAAATAVFYGVHGNWEMGIINAAAILIVACPCAMGLATPAAIMAGANAAARHGILIRDGAALEKCGIITAILFDKTGTLTEGRPRVEKFVALGEDAEAIARALASPSQHPYSQAVAAHLDSVRPAELTAWREERGQGVSAQWNGKPVFLGSLKSLRERNVDSSAIPNDFAGTILCLAVEGKIAAAISLTDPLKPRAVEVVRQLAASGLKVHLVSGDSEKVVRQIGVAVGIESTFAEVRPEEKSAIIERLQAAGERIAFVGDGINDSPALAQADLGIAVTRASDVAREAADILLLNADIEAIPQALGICRATLLTIKQNLFWAFFYNVAAIPLAALGDSAADRLCGGDGCVGPFCDREQLAAFAAAGDGIGLIGPIGHMGPMRSPRKHLN